MGKLYYITGKDANTRAKVYRQILQWSSVQQTYPLQAFPLPNNETPNTYLYNYLGHGSPEQLNEFLQQYGEAEVEPIYLRLSQESEDGLLKMGIFQSYDPYEDLAQCIQEIVETVFTGYQRTSYNFEAALKQAQEEQARQYAEAQRAKQAEQENQTKAQPEKEKKPKKKRNIKPVLILGAWAVVVCFCTVWIFQLTVGTEKIYPKNQDIIVLTPPTDSQENDETNTASTDTPSATPKPMTSQNPIGNGLTKEPFVPVIPDGYVIDLGGPVLADGMYQYPIHYTVDGKEQYYNYFSRTEEQEVIHQTSLDGKIGATLLQGNIWYYTQKEIGTIAGDISLFAMSVDGTYLFYFSEATIFCFNTQTGDTENVFDTQNVTALVASPNGEYCAFKDQYGSVTIVQKETREGTTLGNPKFETLQTVDNTGNWVVGKAKLGTEESLICRGKNGDINWLTTEPTSCYVPYSGAGMLYAKQDQIWICEDTGSTYPLQRLNNKGWNLLSTESNTVYEVAEGIFMYDDQIPFYIQVEGDWNGICIYEVVYDAVERKYQTKPVADDVLYADEHVILRKKDLPETILNSLHYVIYATENNGFLYVGGSGGLSHYKNGQTEWVMDFANVEDYKVGKNGTVYYITRSGILGFVKYEGNTFVKTSHKESFLSQHFLSMEVKNAGVYLYCDTSTQDQVYFVTEQIVRLLGTVEAGG